MKMTKKVFSCLLLGYMFVGCTPKPENQKKQELIATDTLSAKVNKLGYSYHFDTTTNLGHGFEIFWKEEKDSIKNRSLLDVKHNNSIKFSDTSDYYILDDSLNPTIIVLGDELFEIFLEVDNSPNKNYLKMLKIQSGKIVDSQKIPSFSYKPCHLFDDTTVFYADTWDNREAWQDSAGNDWITCDPILYYKLTKTGLLLDSAYTILKNKEIYGITNVFEQHKLTSMAHNKYDAFKKEIERIKNCNSSL